MQGKPCCFRHSTRVIFHSNVCKPAPKSLVYVAPENRNHEVLYMGCVFFLEYCIPLSQTVRRVRWQFIRVPFIYGSRASST